MAIVVPRAPLVSPTPPKRRLASDAIQNLAALLSAVPVHAQPHLFDGAPPRKRLASDLPVQGAPYGVQTPPQRNLYDQPWRAPRRLAADAPLQVTTYLPAPTFPQIVNVYDTRPERRKTQDFVFPNVAAVGSTPQPQPIVNVYDSRPRPRAWQDWSPPNLAVLSGFQTPPRLNAYDPRPRARALQDSAAPNVAILAASAATTVPARNLYDPRPPPRARALDLVLVQRAPYSTGVSLPVANRFDGAPRAKLRVDFLFPNVAAFAAAGSRPPVFAWHDPRPPRKRALQTGDIWQSNRFGLVPILLGGPRYIVKQPGTREFTVEQDARRPFTIAQLEPRLFTITSDERHNMGFKFEIKEPHELIPLTFDFTPDLLPGETLANTPTVSVAVIRGADANPNGVFNGSAGFDSSMKKVIVPVQSGVAQADYEFTVTVDTTTATKRLTLVGVLPVRSKFE